VERLDPAGNILGSDWKVGPSTIRIAFLDGNLIGRLFEMAVSNWTLVQKRYA
jgi:hypothetical protein